jgi:hypothetical protein
MASNELIAKANEFWYVFDARYTSNDVAQLYLDCNLYKPNPNPTGGPIVNFDWMFLSLKDKFNTDPLDYEKLFTIDVSKYEKGIKALSKDQITIIYNHLRNFHEIREALELFGQGVLYDERRRNVHQMQGRFPQSLVGYRRWHGFARAAFCVGEEPDFWLNLDRSVLLAYLLQSELRPLDTRPDNPYISEERLNEYRCSCMSLEFQNLDEAFVNFFP